MELFLLSFKQMLFLLLFFFLFHVLCFCEMHIAWVWRSKHLVFYCCVHKVGLCFHKLYTDTKARRRYCMYLCEYSISARSHRRVCARRVLYLLIHSLSSVVYTAQNKKNIYINTHIVFDGSMCCVVRSPDVRADQFSLRVTSKNFIAYKILFILKCSLLIGWCSR